MILKPPRPPSIGSGRNSSCPSQLTMNEVGVLPTTRAITFALGKSKMRSSLFDCELGADFFFGIRFGCFVIDVLDFEILHVGVVGLEFSVGVAHLEVPLERHR